MAVSNLKVDVPMIINSFKMDTQILETKLKKDIQLTSKYALTQFLSKLSNNFKKGHSLSFLMSLLSNNFKMDIYSISK